MVWEAVIVFYSGETLKLQKECNLSLLDCGYRVVMFPFPTNTIDAYVGRRRYLLPFSAPFSVMMRLG